MKSVSTDTVKKSAKKSINFLRVLFIVAITVVVKIRISRQQKLNINDNYSQQISESAEANTITTHL